jgi:hypothetical protein
VHLLTYQESMVLLTGSLLPHRKPHYRVVQSTTCEESVSVAPARATTWYITGAQKVLSQNGLMRSEIAAGIGKMFILTTGSRPTTHPRMLVSVPTTLHSVRRMKLRNSHQRVGRCRSAWQTTHNLGLRSFLRGLKKSEYHS